MRRGCQSRRRCCIPKMDHDQGLDSVTSYCHDRPMPDEPYSLTDLVRLAGVTPRTVRYYVAQGLLPSPEQAGPSTRYGEGHLARLRLIRRLQRDHLPLAEIRARLDGLDEQQILDAAGADDAVGPGRRRPGLRPRPDGGVRHHPVDGAAARATARSRRARRAMPLARCPRPRCPSRRCLPP